MSKIGGNQTFPRLPQPEVFMLSFMASSLKTPCLSDFTGPTMKHSEHGGLTTLPQVLLLGWPTTTSCPVLNASNMAGAQGDGQVTE